VRSHPSFKLDLNVTGAGAGLQNVGNSCYLNSVLQCVIYTPAMLTYLLTCDHAKSCEYTWGGAPTIILTHVICTGTQQPFCALCEIEQHAKVLNELHVWHANDTLTLYRWYWTRNTRGSHPLSSWRIWDVSTCCCVLSRTDWVICRPRWLFVVQSRRRARIRVVYSEQNTPRVVSTIQRSLCQAEPWCTLCRGQVSASLACRGIYCVD